MSVFVRLPDGSQCGVEVPPGGAVADLHAALRDGGAAADLRLFFGDVELVDAAAPLGDLGIGSEAQLEARAAPAFPEQVLADLPADALRGWRLHYDAPYDEDTQLAQLCGAAERYVVLAARRGGEPLHVAACGEAATVFGEAMDIGMAGWQACADGPGKRAVAHRGVWWYCARDASCGFADGEAVSLLAADSAYAPQTPWCKNPAACGASTEERARKGRLRLSWNINPPGQSTGGFRAGNYVNLGQQPRGWRKLVFYSDEPTLQCSFAELRMAMELTGDPDPGDLQK